MRGVSALPNVFAHESRIDELARRAGEDPIAFRLRYLNDPRAVALIEALIRQANWQDGPASIAGPLPLPGVSLYRLYPHPRRRSAGAVRLPDVAAAGHRSALSVQYPRGIFARNLLFLTPGAMQEDPAQSAARNRGAYLAEGLGHCSACHSPRNVLFGEKPVATTAGGVAEGWTAPALTGRSPAPLDWTQQDLVDFMRTGYSANHGVAAGPIAPVIEEGLSRLPQADLQAIAVYLRSYHPETAAGATAAALNAQAERQVEP